MHLAGLFQGYALKRYPTLESDEGRYGLMPQLVL